MEDVLIHRIAGCLIGAAYGDALGAPTENRTREQIFEKWGYVNQFLTPPQDVFARGNQVGQVTDDFSMAYAAIQEILKASGRLDDEVAKQALLEWASDERMLEQFAGPTSQKFIKKLRGDAVPEGEGFEAVNDNRRASNGGAMKIGPVACFAKGDLDKTIELTRIICFPTHGNPIAMSAACAVSGAVAAALAGKSLCGVFQDAVACAIRGERIGAAGNTIAGPSMPKRLKFALTLGTEAPDLSQAMDELRRYFDCSGMAADSVPVSFGLMAAAQGDAVAAIEAAANIGNDTDTMATIAGAVLGAYQGDSVFSKAMAEQLDAANGYQLQDLAKQIANTNLDIAGRKCQ